MPQITLLMSAKCHGGFQKIYRHYSHELKCEMNFSIYIPPKAEEEKCSVLMWLSGLTCTEKNFIEKSGFQKYAAYHGIIVVGPDTSPRGCNIEGEEDSWDFGTGAGFYVDATEPKWKDNYRMYSYVTEELPKLIEEHFPVNGKMSISGHSMGGHGALVCALRNPGKYVSVSAFAPIANPTECPWGQKCFRGYLGEDKSSWMQYDATELAKNYKGPFIKILIYQGTEDIYLKEQLLPENFVEACSENENLSTLLVNRPGYDHGYYFVSTFMEDHFKMHAGCLQTSPAV